MSIRGSYRSSSATCLAVSRGKLTPVFIRRSPSVLVVSVNLMLLGNIFLGCSRARAKGVQWLRKAVWGPELLWEGRSSSCQLGVTILDVMSHMN